MDSKVPFKIECMYHIPKITLKNNFWSGGQKSTSYLEVKVAKLPIERFSVLGLQNTKMFLFIICIIPLFSCSIILVALQRGLFPYLPYKIEKNYLQNLEINVILMFLQTFFSPFYMVDRKKFHMHGY